MKYGRQRGVALIMVMMLATVLFVFALFFITMTKQNLQQAQLLFDKAKAEVEADTRIAEVVFSIYQRLRVEEEARREPALFSIANFWGEPFTWQPGTQVAITDLAGQLTLVPFREDEWYYMLGKAKVPEDQIVILIDRIQDWGDSNNFRRVNGMETPQYLASNLSLRPRNAMMQSIDEVVQIPGFPESAKSIIKDKAVYYGGGFRNPYYATQEMAEFYLGQEGWSQLQALRQEQAPRIRHFDASAIPVLRGNVESVGAQPSRGYVLNIEVEKGRARALRKLVFYRRETFAHPFSFASAK